MASAPDSDPDADWVELLSFAAGLLFWHELPEPHRLARPDLERPGILPEIAEGLGHSSNLTVRLSVDHPRGEGASSGVGTR